MAREISEHDATLAVDAAARAAYEARAKEMLDAHDEHATPWDEATPALKLAWRNSVLKPVWAALGALPDQRRAAWAEGYDHAWHNWTGTHDPGDHANPYPAEEG